MKTEREKDKELGQLKAKIIYYTEYITAQTISFDEVADANIQLQAKLAMCVEAIKSNLADLSIEGMYDEEIFNAAINATEQDVKQWQAEIEAKAIEECANICAESELPFDIDLWLSSTKKEMTAHTALALAKMLRKLANEKRGNNAP